MTSSLPLPKALTEKYERAVRGGIISREEADAALARRAYTQDLNTGHMEPHFMGSCSQYCPCRESAFAANE